MTSHLWQQTSTTLWQGAGAKTVLVGQVRATHSPDPPLSATLRQPQLVAMGRPRTGGLLPLLPTELPLWPSPQPPPSCQGGLDPGGAKTATRKTSVTSLSISKSLAAWAREEEGEIQGREDQMGLPPHHTAHIWTA